MTQPDTQGPPGGPPERTRGGLRAWVLWTALRSPANQRAALVTLLVALAVGGITLRPLDAGYELDLRHEAGGPRDAVRLWGFGPAREVGRRLVGGGEGNEASRVAPEARIELPHPLPEAFVLHVEGFSEAGPRTVEIVVDGRAQEVRFARALATETVEFRGVASSRALVLRSTGPGTPIVLRRLMLQ